MRRANLLPVIVLLLLSAVVYLVSAQGNAPAGAQWEYLTVNSSGGYSYDTNLRQFTNYLTPDSDFLAEVQQGAAQFEPGMSEVMLPALMLNLYGRDGWELVHMTPDPFYAVMRRPVAP